MEEYNDQKLKFGLLQKKMTWQSAFSESGGSQV